MDKVVIENKCQSSELLKEPEQDKNVFLNVVLDGRVDISVDPHEAKHSSSFHYILFYYYHYFSLFLRISSVVFCASSFFCSDSVL